MANVTRAFPARRTGQGVGLKVLKGRWAASLLEKRNSSLQPVLELFFGVIALDTKPFLTTPVTSVKLVQIPTMPKITSRSGDGSEDGPLLALWRRLPGSSSSSRYAPASCFLCWRLCSGYRTDSPDCLTSLNGSTDDSSKERPPVQRGAGHSCVGRHVAVIIISDNVSRLSLCVAQFVERGQGQVEGVAHFGRPRRGSEQPASK